MVIRRSFVGLLMVLGLLAFVPLGGADASCAGPALRVGSTDTQHPRVRAGAAVSVRGRFFVNGCDDTGGVAVSGCGGKAEPRETERPMRDVRLVLRQHGRHWNLGTSDAGPSRDNSLGGRIVWEARIPHSVRPGPAVLVAGPTRLPVTILRSAATGVRQGQ